MRRISCLWRVRDLGKGVIFGSPLRPTLIAGRTFRLVRFVNGIGRRTAPFLEQFIEDDVGVIVPDQIGLQSFVRRRHRFTELV